MCSVWSSQGRYPDLKDRSELWPLLVKIVTTKAANQVKRQRALKRGAGRVVNERTAQDSSSAAGVLENIAASEPTPELIAQVTEQCNRLFESLEDDQLRVIVRLKLEGYTNKEIAEKLQVVTRTVDRRLRLIRGRWEKLI